jgi:hypothetical protein
MRLTFLLIASSLSSTAWIPTVGTGDILTIAVPVIPWAATVTAPVRTSIEPRFDEQRFYVLKGAAATRVL